MTASVFPGSSKLALIQGWFPEGGDGLTGAFASAGGAGVLRLPAFPDPEELRARIRALQLSPGALLGIDVRGLRGQVRAALEAAREEGATFLVHGPSVPESLRKAWEGLDLRRFALASGEAEARQALDAQPDALVLEGLGTWFDSLRASCRLPMLGSLDAALEDGRAWMKRGLDGFSFRSPKALRDASDLFAELRQKLEARFPRALAPEAEPLPRMRIGKLDLPYPIIQGGMGVGVSWSHLAGAVAETGCVGIVSAIGTAYGHPEGVTFAQGRPVGPGNLNHGPALARLIRDARDLSKGFGAVGINALCAIEDYDRVVREGVEAGAQLAISGAGLPLKLPELAGPDVAVVPIVSSARALKLLCKTWERKYHRLPDAVVLEGPLSGGHQGYTVEQCGDPAFALEAILPEVLAERDLWGAFPVIVAGGIWDGADIRRFLALGAGGVQMGTRFIGTHECDAADHFKDVILQSRVEDISLIKSPVGMPARAVHTPLLDHVADGSAPAIKCISNCLLPCSRGEGARGAGYCIADRLADAHLGDVENGLYFTGSNGWRLKNLISVRELVEELTGDYGLTARG